MNIVTSASILGAGLILAACTAVQPEVTRSAELPAQHFTTTAPTAPASTTVMTPPRWICTASGAGMAGSCEHLDAARRSEAEGTPATEDQD